MFTSENETNLIVCLIANGMIVYVMIHVAFIKFVEDAPTCTSLLSAFV